MNRPLLPFLGLAIVACSLSAVGQSAPPPLEYTPLATPCRAVDTRQSGGAIQGGSTRTFSPFSGACNIPIPADGVIVYAANVTVVPHGYLGVLTAWPAGGPQPLVSLLNSLDGRTKANAALLNGGTKGNISVFAEETTDFILDVSGYFTSTAAGMVYVPVTPCRIIDTRNGTGGAGITYNGPPAPDPLMASQARTWEIAYPVTVDDPVEGGNTCNLPSDVGGAYSVNVTVIPMNRQPVWFASAWGASSNITTGANVEPPFSNVNATTGMVTANAAIINGSGRFTAYSDVAADLVVDVTGWFAPANLAPQGLSLYALPPCRAFDSRATGEYGSLPGTIQIPLAPNPNCQLPTGLPTPHSFVLNATVVPYGGLPYLTLWPDGQAEPLVSTLNSDDGYITSNMAIVGTGPYPGFSSVQAIQANSVTKTELILDESGVFALNPKAKQPKVVFIGDETSAFWSPADHPNWISRAVAGNTTDQMIARFQTDVIALHPDVVHIMGGAYDAKDETWPLGSQCGPDTCANIEAMSQMAHDAGIQVVVGTPVDVAGMTEDEEINDEVFTRILRESRSDQDLWFLLDYRRMGGNPAAMTQMAEAEIGLAAGSPIVAAHITRKAGFR